MKKSRSLRYDYDLKTNKDELSDARNNFIDFIEELNSLNSEEEIKTFYESKMDVDLFLKTYACNVLLGMDDDYWRNHNNYYFYFDKNGKAYFIPYDYDNILGTNCFTDTATRNPLDWGEGVYEAPLIEKLLSVPEFKQKYVDYLLALSKSSVFVDESQSEITRLQNLVTGLISSDDIEYEDTFKEIKDDVAYWCSNRGKYQLLSGDETSNYFRAKAKSVQVYCKPNYVDITLDLNKEDARLLIKNEYFQGTRTFSKAIAETAVSNLYSKIFIFGNNDEEYKFAGWYDAATDGELVTYIPTENSTLYAHYEKRNAPTYKPYKYWVDENGPHITFTFNPQDFYIPEDFVIESCVPACELNDWGQTWPKMEKQENGTYTYTYSDKRISSIYAGYKFVANDIANDKLWLGWSEYAKELPEEYYKNQPNYDFMMPELNE